MKKEKKGINKMIKYRPHCGGGIAKAMSEAKEFNTIEEMIDYIYEDHKNIWGFPVFEKSDISIEDPPHGDDNRIGWKNVRYVLTNKYGNDNYIELYGCPQTIGYMTYSY
jgi:hypothetical protein